LKSIIQRLATDPTLILVFGAFTVVGAVVGAYAIYVTIKLFRISNRLPRYTIRSIPILSDIPTRLPEIKIHHDGYGDQIRNLTVTRILLWNAGTVSIRKDDVPPSDPITLHALKDAVILGAQVMKIENPASNFTATFNRRDRKSVVFAFDFMNQNQSILVKVVHTGKASDDLKMSGQVIGSGPFVPIPYRIFAGEAGRRPNIYRYASAFVKTKHPRLYGTAFLGVALLVVVHSIINIITYFQRMPRDQAIAVTQIEFMIFGIPTAILAHMAYLILFCTPPRFFDEFEAEI